MPPPKLQRRGTALRYVKIVPKRLRDVVGFSAWPHYFPASVSYLDAQARAVRLSEDYDALIAKLGALSSAERKQIIDAGGLRKFQKIAAYDEELRDFARGLAAVPDEWGPSGDDETDAELETLQIKLRTEARAADRRLDLSRRVNAKAGERAPDGLHTLIDLAERVKPQSAKSIKRARLYVDRLIKHLGTDRKPNTITQADAVSWRNALADKDGFSGTNQDEHLSKLRSLFAVGVSEGVLSANPFSGVKARYTADELKASKGKRAFTAKELRLLDKAARTESAEFYLVTRCQMFSGAGSSEICGLRVGDVKEIDGVLCFDFNDLLRSLKNRQRTRVVPIAACLRTAIKKQAKGRASDAVLFDGVAAKTGDPGHIVQTIGSSVVRNNVSDDERLTHNCLRHSWKQRAEDLGVPENIMRAIMGHRKGHDAHSLAYGKRPGVKVLMQAMELVAKDIMRCLRTTE
ncbi:MAG: tyrosine-type recombinase/integrase [Hyphomicrobium sp.]